MSDSGSQWVLPDLFGRVRLAMSSSGTTVATAVFDVQRFGTGTLASGVIRNTYGSGDEDGLAGFLGGRSLAWNGAPGGDSLCLARCAIMSLTLWMKVFAQCMVHSGTPCKLCIGFALGVCVGTVSACIGAVRLCAQACGRSLGTCVTAASIAATLFFRDCSRRCLR